MGLDQKSPQSTESQVTEGNTKLTLGQRANEVLNSAQVDENNNVILPQDIPEDVREFVIVEKQRRDTQSGYTKGQQRIKELEAVNNSLLDQVTNITFTEAEQTSLDALKYEDVDKWYEEKQRLEQSKLIDARANVKKSTLEASQAAGRDFEMARRSQVLQEFSAKTGVILTDDIIANDVPPRIAQKLEQGMDFEAWLWDVKNYFDTPKKVENEEVTNVTNIGSAGAASGDPGVVADQSYEEMYKNASL